MWTMLGWLRADAALASCTNRRFLSGSDFLGRENFDGDEPVQVRVAGLVCTPDPSHRGRAFRGSDSAGRCVRPWHNAELWYASQIDSRQRVRWIERPAGWTLLMPDTYVDVRLWCGSEVSRSEWADWYGTALLSKIRISPGKRRPQNQTALLVPLSWNRCFFWQD